jgi:hypothetical protein
MLSALVDCDDACVDEGRKWPITDLQLYGGSMI